jgi:hypothetical protein
MFKKACLRGKEHFNLLILGSLPTRGFFPTGLPTQNKKGPDFSIKFWKHFWQKIP